MALRARPGVHATDRRAELARAVAKNSQTPNCRGAGGAGRSDFIFNFNLNQMCNVTAPG